MPCKVRFPAKAYGCCQATFADGFASQAYVHCPNVGFRYVFAVDSTHYSGKTGFQT
jgi:hypothetical protein